LNYVAGAISAAVINNEEFPLSEILKMDGTHSLGQVARNIPRRDNERNERFRSLRHHS
jgi:hypothetical protein